MEQFQAEKQKKAANGQREGTASRVASFVEIVQSTPKAKEQNVEASMPQ